MQNVLRSSKKGIVSKIRVMLGSSLRADDIIMDFMSEGEK